MAHIRANCGVDRELDRYLKRLETKHENEAKFDLGAISTNADS